MDIKLNKIKFGKIKKYLEKLLLTVAEHAFSACLLLFLLALILGGFLFYKYSISAQKVGKDALDEFFLLKEEIYQEILSVWQEHEKEFIEADFKEYPNPFERPILVPEEEIGPEEATPEATP